MVGMTYLYIDTIFAFCRYVDLLVVFVLFSCGGRGGYPSLLFNWMFEHGCLDTCCLGVLYACALYFGICTCSAQ